MAYSENKKPGELTALTSLATDDVFIVGDTSDASEVAKGITKADLIADLAPSFTGTFTVASSAEINTGTDNVKGITPAGLNGSLYREITFSATEPASPETGDMWVDETVETRLDPETVLFSSPHTQYLTSVSNSEIFRTTLATGESLQINGVQALQRNGGSVNTSFTLVVYDVTNSTTLHTCHLNDVDVVDITTSAAITLSLKVTNGTGADVDACYLVKGYYVY